MKQFVKLCLGHPAVVSINWWGFSDRNIWLPGGGLVDEEYNPKPVYVMPDKLINETWKTNAALQTDSQGDITFRGFFGDYEVIMTTTNDKKLVYNIHVSKNEENKWIFTVD
ncbi:MAG TPA: endo-1,4-beta-xylanase [Bacteroidales bacterium]|nr:endo-1,4-beta-xylanase [Bacteroidales bacterium]